MPIFTGTPGDDVIPGTNLDDEISGLGGNDQLLGFEGNDIIDGGTGDDFLRGDEGNDILLGGDDDDYLRGGLGDDFLDGGSGLDRVAFVGATSGITVDLSIQGVAQDTGTGLDTLNNIEHASGTEFADTLIGNDGDNWLWGQNGDDNYSAGGGNDLVEAGPGNVTADGGAGTDSFSVWANNEDPGTAVTVSLLLQGSAQPTGIGSMTLTGFENLSGSVGSDTLIGDSGVNVLAGDLGNDILRGGDGNDTLYGDGRIIVDYLPSGTSGPIVTYGDISVVFGLTPGDDTLEGGDGDDTLDGGGGSDSAAYSSATGAVQVDLTFGFASGAAGDDTLISIENFLGSAFDDFARGNAGANVLAGFAGHDFLRGLDGNDIMTGDDGDDYLDGGLGNDILDGGAGWDRVSYAPSAAGGVTVDLNIQGVAQATGQGNDTLIGIEHASGTIFNDVIIGNGGDNWLWGGSAGSGVTGNDNISAGGGNDLVEVGTGNHVLDGGTGTDTLSLWGNGSDITAAGVTASLELQGTSQSTEQGFMLLTGFENLSGSNFDDGLTGDDGDNVLAGDMGNDTLTGGRGNDALYGDGRIIIDDHGTGGSGPIVTYADVTLLPFGLAPGNDILDGGRGNDVLNGGGGDDELTGGNGDDIFVVGPSSGNDVVSDFHNNQDRIRFEGVAGVDDFSDLVITSSGRDVHITWGDGTNSITLEGTNIRHIDATDFIFI